MKITTRHGTLEIRPTHHGRRVIRINGERVTEADFLIEVVDAYYRLGLDHPGGSAGFVADLTGLDTTLGCAGCGNDDATTTRCPTCTLSRCAQCALTHDNGPLCLTTRENADVHRQMRGDDDFDQSDWYFGRRAIASSFIRRGQH